MKKTALLLAVVVLLSTTAVFADQVADGKKVFEEKKCAMCHGENFDKKPVTPTDASVKFLTTDAKHKAKIADEATAKAVVAYLKTLKK